MTTLPSMGLTLPTRGSAGSGLWGDTLDADLGLLDAHDHTSGKGARIPTAGIGINADLPFSALWAPTQLHRVQFSAIAVATFTGGMTKSLFVSDGTGGLVANELYWCNSAGNKVQLTSGNVLNFSAFVGGIGGDYQSVGAQLNYVDSQKGYEFRESTTDSHNWSRLRSGDLRLFPFNTNGATFVGMACPGAIAGSYTITWPLALPGASNLVAIDNTGQVAFSNTISQAVTLSAGAIVASSQNITLSGTGVVKHGTYTLQIAGAGFVMSPTDTGGSYIGSGQATGTPLNAFTSITLAQGKRILAIRVFIQDGAGAPTKLQASFRTISSTGTATTVASSSVSAGSGSNQTLTISGLSTTVAASTGYAIHVLTTTGTDLVRLWMAEVDYDNP